jgi:hypothetical protein
MGMEVDCIGEKRPGGSVGCTALGETPVTAGREGHGGTRKLGRLNWGGTSTLAPGGPSSCTCGLPSTPAGHGRRLFRCKVRVGPSSPSGRMR